MTDSRQPRRDYAYYRDALNGQSMPCAFVDLELFDLNIAQIKGRMGNKPMRIASKSIRSRPLIERILKSDARFKGIMCYSAWEAVYLSQSGLDDLLVAYPIWHEGQIEAICGEVALGKKIVVMMDSPEHAARLGSVAARLSVTLPVSIDIDMSSDFPGLHFGVMRSPVTNVEKAMAVVEAIEKQPALKLDGVMGYEAQIAGVPDSVPGAKMKNQMVRFLKNRSLREIINRREQIVQAIHARGHALRFVNGGGTGSLESTSQETSVTEVTAGSAFFAPTLFDDYVKFRHLPAAGFAIEITRRPSQNIYTCQGGGYVASGAAGKGKLPKPYLPEGCKLLDLEGTGEVQTPIQYDGPEKLSHGDPILMRHAKAGELCEHFNELLLISDGKITGAAATYRGDHQCFIG